MTAMKIGMKGVLGLNNSGQLSCYGKLFTLIRRLYLFQKKRRCMPVFCSVYAVQITIPLLFIPNDSLYDYTPWLNSVL